MSAKRSFWSKKPCISLNKRFTPRTVWTNKLLWLCAKKAVAIQKARIIVFTSRPSKHQTGKLAPATLTIWHFRGLLTSWGSCLYALRLNINFPAALQSVVLAKRYEVLALAFSWSAAGRGVVIMSLHLGQLFELRASGHTGWKRGDKLTCPPLDNTSAAYGAHHLDSIRLIMHNNNT